ncbi:MAG: sigma-54-dependent Fis family transcriptional regulator, partial [Deltaproteobacteria bacterium]|nr:sigma-54-dependent Fis family transcriptional regulator [Deltaproteobacteria bacterium]
MSKRDQGSDWLQDGRGLAPTLLVVDDDSSNLESLEGVFAREGYTVLLAAGGREALESVRKRRVDVVLTDLMMPDMDGLDLLRSVKTVSPETEVILMTAYGTVARAVEAMKEGAYDFVTKPFKKIQIIKGVRRAMEKQVLLLENRNLRSLLETSGKDRVIVGNSLVIRKLMDMARQVAASEANVLLSGESGTGKELVARQLHQWSRRADRIFIPFNCAALPRELAEAELFGHERGAFTGAHKERPGLFREADGGTLFLDEISELDLSLQGKLLRVLQEGEVRPVGGARPVQVDVRLISATKQDLEELVKQGQFREDLFYRLNVIMLKLPALRERKEDVPLLADFFLRRYAKKNNRQIGGIARAALDALTAFNWPGNVRELENVIERAVVLSKGDMLTEEDLPEPV